MATTNTSNNQVVEGPAMGRSGPRSRTGCQSCKQSRVRCDETRPKCHRCERMRLSCEYVQPNPRQRRTGRSQVPTVQSPPTPLSQSPSTLDYGYRMDVLSTDDSLASATATSTSIIDLPQDSLGARSGTQQGAPSESSGFPSTDNQNHLTSSEILNNYLLLSQPTFPFPTIEFTENLNPVDMWFSSTSVPNLGTTSQSSHLWNAEVMPTASTNVGVRADSTVRDPQNRANSSDVRQPQGNDDSYIAGLLSVAQQRMFLDYFEHNIHPPSSLADIDPLGWMRVKRYLLRMTHESTNSVTSALFALTGLLYMLDLRSMPTSSQTAMKISVSRLQEAAIAAIESEVAWEGWEKSKDSLLASLFLLAWFEVTIS
jgi:hypothetical protein